MLVLLVLAGPAGGQTDREIEEVFWESVECKSAGQVEAYLEVYPTGAYVEEARKCLEEQLGLDRTARVSIQQGLTALDYEVGAADGLFGPSTRRALRQWQAGKGFAATGYLTRAQADALMAQGRDAVAAVQAEAERQAEEQRRQAEAERQRQAEEQRQAEAEQQRQAEEVRREAEEKDEQAQLAGGEAGPRNWGMTVADITPEIRRRLQLDAAWFFQAGFVVSEVEPGSAAQRAGIQRGDVIEEVNRQAVASVSDFTTILSQMEEKESLLFLVRRNKLTSYFALRQKD